MTTSIHPFIDLDMAKYIDADRLRAEIERRMNAYAGDSLSLGCTTAMDGFEPVLEIIDSLQQEQPDNMIQWTGNNLKEVIDFTGKSPRFGEWFKSWKEYENYVHAHNDILKLFFEDGSHYEVPVGAWIIKTPDGYNLPSVAKYVQQKQPEVDLKEEIDKMWNPRFNLGWNDNSLLSINHRSFEAIARHFFNLGLNARK